MSEVVLRAGKRPLVLISLLIFVVLAAGACVAPPVPAGDSQPATAAPAPAAASAPTQAPAAEAPVAVSDPVDADDGIPVGVDANGNFYRGNPDASVRLVEFSDYQ